VLTEQASVEEPRMRRQARSDFGLEPQNPVPSQQALGGRHRFEGAVETRGEHRAMREHNSIINARFQLLQTGSGSEDLQSDRAIWGTRAPKGGARGPKWGRNGQRLQHRAAQPAS
jgi:hypothetical protein